MGPGETPPAAGRWRALAVLGLALLLVAIDATVLNLALPSLARDLGPSATDLLWIVDAYSLVLAGLLVTAGALGDRWGRKRLLLLGIGLFGAASVLAAFAPSAGALIAARALLGVAGALIMPSTLSILRQLFVDPRERTLAIGVWGGIAAAGAAVGPIVGGVLLEFFAWGAVFLVNVPVALLVLVLGARLLPESRDPRPGRLDLPSVPLSVGGMVGLVWAVKEAGVHGLGDARALGAGVVGAVLLAAFLRRQTRLAEPLLDVGLFRSRRFSAAAVCNLLALFGLASLLFLVSQQLQFVAGHSPLGAGLRLLPLTVASLAAAPLVGPLARRWGERGPIALGLGVVGGALLLLGGAAGGGYVPLAVALAGVGAGAGLAMTASSAAIVGAVPPERAGRAAAISETGYELGTALGVAVLGSVMNAAYRGALGEVAGVPAAASGAARDSLPAAAEAAAALGGPAGAALLAAARAAFLDGIEVTTAVGALAMAVATTVAWVLLPGREGAAGTRDGRVPSPAGAEPPRAARPSQGAPRRRGSGGASRSGAVHSYRGDSPTG